jgi:hypothetical protein
MEVEGTLVADPTGGTTPTARTLANTETLTAKAGQSVTDTGFDMTTGTKLQSVSYEGFDISDYYEGDVVFLRLELDTDGGAGDLGVITVSVSGARWTLGQRVSD